MQISVTEKYPVVKCFSLSLSVPHVIRQRSCSDVFSSVSMKSDQSKGDGPNLSEGKSFSAKRYSMSHVLCYIIAFSAVSAEFDEKRKEKKSQNAVF